MSWQFNHDEKDLLKAINLQLEDVKSFDSLKSEEDSDKFCVIAAFFLFRIMSYLYRKSFCTQPELALIFLRYMGYKKTSQIIQSFYADLKRVFENSYHSDFQAFKKQILQIIDTIIEDISIRDDVYNNVVKSFGEEALDPTEIN